MAGVSSHAEVDYGRFMTSLHIEGSANDPVIQSDLGDTRAQMKAMKAPIDDDPCGWRLIAALMPASCASHSKLSCLRCWQPFGLTDMQQAIRRSRALCPVPMSRCEFRLKLCTVFTARRCRQAGIACLDKEGPTL